MSSPPVSTRYSASEGRTNTATTRSAQSRRLSGNDGSRPFDGGVLFQMSEIRWIVVSFTPDRNSRCSISKRPGGLAVLRVKLRTFYFGCSKPIISTRERRHFVRSKPLKIIGIVSSADCGLPTEVQCSISNGSVKIGIAFHRTVRSYSYFRYSQYIAA